jgi:hypothetical protein
MNATFSVVAQLAGDPGVLAKPLQIPEMEENAVDRLAAVDPRSKQDSLERRPLRARASPGD